MAKKPTPLESLDSNPRYAPAATILRTLEQGAREIQEEIDALRIEQYLGSATAALTGNSEQIKQLKERVGKYRSKAPSPPKTPTGSVETSLPASVATALELIRGGIRPARRDLSVRITELEQDKDLIHVATIEQCAIVEGLRNELVAEQSARDREPWAALQLRKFRAAQALAATKDEEDDFRKSRIDAGFTPWRSDLLPTIASRPVLVLGSERDWDSEISRSRRQLEEQKLI